MENIVKIHEQLYTYLSSQHEKDKNFRFTLRSVNRANRLNEGYWFTGNDNYLAFSFWTGSDWRNKTSNIIFVVEKIGKSWLEFVSHEGEKKQFFSKVADVLDMQQKSSTSDESNFRWVKNYEGTDYKKSLETFLKRDKRIIDSYILSEKMEKIFAPIPLKDFQNSKRKTDDIRIKRQEGQVNIEQNASIEAPTKSDELLPIKIKSLRIENISLFKSDNGQSHEPVEIFFHDRLTCFIGLNGTGKSSIFKALVLAFTGYEQNEKIGEDALSLLREKIQELLHVVGEDSGKPLYANAGFAEVTYNTELNEEKSEEGKYKNTVLFSNQGNEVVISDDSNSDFVNIKDDRYKCLFMAIPQLHGAVESKPRKEKRPSYPNVGDAVSMLSGYPEDRLNAFSDWLRGLNNRANAKQAEDDKEPIERKLIHDTFELMSKITGENVRLHKIFVTGKLNEPDPIWANIGEQSEPILLNLVSQGYQSVFSIIGNFLQRLVDVTPEGGDYKETHAILLIDEIDTYLHPQWQYRILGFLVELFPNVQFIVTTHSPYVVGSIPNDKIKIYICEKDGLNANIVAIDNLYGANVERITRSVFRTPARTNRLINFEDKITKLRRCIQDNHFSEAENLLTELEKEKINDSDPEITSIKLLLRTKKRLANV